MIDGPDRPIPSNVRSFFERGSPMLLLLLRTCRYRRVYSRKQRGEGVEGEEGTRIIRATDAGSAWWSTEKHWDIFVCISPLNIATEWKEWQRFRSFRFLLTLSSCLFWEDIVLESSQRLFRTSSFYNLLIIIIYVWCCMMRHYNGTVPEQTLRVKAKWVNWYTS